MRADARSLMMYWRRTYLKTERKGAPSSVFRKGSFSHRSVEQGQLKTHVIKHLSVTTNATKPFYMRTGAFNSTTPAFAEPGVSISQKLLDGAVPGRVDLQKHPLNRDRGMRRVLLCNEHIRVDSIKLFILPFSEPCKHPSPPAWQTGLRTEWAAPSPLPCKCSKQM